MAYRYLTRFDEQASITATGDDFITSPKANVNIACTLTAGTPTTGARVHYTLDTEDKIIGGTAKWIASPEGNRTTSGGETLLRPVTGVRLVATDGTWTVQVRQEL